MSTDHTLQKNQHIIRDPSTGIITKYNYIGYGGNDRYIINGPTGPSGTYESSYGPTGPSGICRSQYDPRDIEYEFNMNLIGYKNKKTGEYRNILEELDYIKRIFIKPLREKSAITIQRFYRERLYAPHKGKFYYQAKSSFEKSVNNI